MSYSPAEWNQVDEEYLKMCGDGGFLRPLHPGEAEAMGVTQKVLGVFVGRSDEGFCFRFLVYSYASVELFFERIAAGPVWSPAQVAEYLGCTLADLGVIRSVK